MKKLLLIAAVAAFASTAMAQNTENGHEYVDLGLNSGLMWATCNVGASSPGEAGLYLQWGETEEVAQYDANHYKYGTFDYNTYSNVFTKYVTKAAYGTVDNKDVLDAEDDAATVLMGGSWRMPSLDDVNELLANTTVKTELIGSVTCYRFTSKNDTTQSIVLPRVGYKQNKSTTSGTAYYMTLNLSTTNNGMVPVLRVKATGDPDVYTSAFRYYGMYVRGVCKPSPVTAVTDIKTTVDNPNAPVYDLSGRVVKGELSQGIYIKNGKKFIVR